MSDYTEELRRKVPYYTMDALRRYVDERTPPGGFLTAVLSNDLMGAFARADDNNRAALYWTVSWIYSCEPGPCHGSREAFENWLSEKDIEETEDARLPAGSELGGSAYPENNQPV